MIDESAFQVLHALALQANREGSTRLDTIMHRARGIAWSQAEAALERLQLLGYVRSLRMGYWFITREGLAALRQHVEAMAREARGD